MGMKTIKANHKAEDDLIAHGKYFIPLLHPAPSLFPF